MDNNWNVPDEKIQESRVHELIVSLNFPIIYTTNYDHNLESAFRIPTSYVFLPRPDPVQETVLGQWGVKTLTEDTDDPGHALVTFLENLQKAI